MIKQKSPHSNSILAIVINFSFQRVSDVFSRYCTQPMHELYDTYLILVKKSIILIRNN